MTPRLRRLAQFAGLAALLGIGLPGLAGPADADSLFGPAASEILEGIRGADVARIPAASGYGAPTIAVGAFTENSVPVPAEVANAWNRRLVAELHRQGQHDFQFVDHSALPALVAEIDRSARSPDEKADRIADLNESLRADILVTGTIVLSGTTPVLTWQAVATESGRLFATTTPLRMPWPEPVVADHALPPPSSSVPAPIPADDPGPRRDPEPFGFHPVTLEAERYLQRLGYDPGPVDGVLTAQTREALRAYQADSALPVNGRMTRQVVDNMRRDTR